MTECEPAARIVAIRHATGYIMCIGKDPEPPHHRLTVMTAPLLSVGTFGTHLISGDRGFSFAGTVPVGIKVGVYASEADGVAAFVSWFKSQDAAFQREHVANLRNDVFAAVLTA